MFLNDGFQTASEGVRKKASSPFFIGMKYQIEIASHYNIYSCFPINACLQVVLIAFLFSVLIGSVYIVDNYYLIAYFIFQCHSNPMLV